MQVPILLLAFNCVAKVRLTVVVIKLVLKIIFHYIFSAMSRLQRNSFHLRFSSIASVWIENCLVRQITFVHSEIPSRSIISFSHIRMTVSLSTQPELSPRQVQVCMI